MFRSVMVPLDGSLLAERAFELALPIVSGSNAELHLATVRRSIPAPAAHHKDVERLYVERTAGNLAQRLGKPVRPVILVDVIAGVPLGEPSRRSVADVLEDYVREKGIDLTVMTTHGRSGLSRFYMGSVAAAFMRYSPSPVLMFKPAEKRAAVTHILVLLDGTTEAQAIVPSAIELAEVASARCTALRIIDPGSDPLRAIKELRDACGALSDAGIDFQAEVRMSANPAAAIIVYAITHDVDVVALTTRTRNPMQRMFLGSVADTLVRKAGRPVLICNPFGQRAASGGIEAVGVERGR